jgi:hypothetical protein
MFKIVKKSNEVRRIYLANDIYIGNFEKDVDGYFYYWPKVEKSGGYWSSSLLKELSFELDKINKPWDRKVNRYFEKLFQS